MTSRKSLLQIALVLGLVSGTSTLLAQMSSRSASVRLAQAPEPAAAPAPAAQPAAPAPAAVPDAAAAPAPAGDITPLESQTAVRREKAVREFMAARGVDDKATQDAIVTYLQEQERAREALAESGRLLLPALVTQGRGATGDAQVEALVAQYQKQLAAFNNRNQQAQTDLEARIGFSKKPRLQAMLLLMGALDQGPRILPVWRPLRPEGVSRPRQPKPAV